MQFGPQTMPAGLLVTLPAPVPVFVTSPAPLMTPLLGAGLSLVQGNVVLLRNAALMENRLVLEARLDGGGVSSTAGSEELLIPAGFQDIEISWGAAGGSGYLQAAVGTTLLTGLTDLDNDELLLDSVRWGANSGTVTASTGSFFLDDFASFR